MMARGHLRGKPVLAFVALLAAWCTTRLMLWEAPFSVSLEGADEMLGRSSAPAAVVPLETFKPEPASLAPHVKPAPVPDESGLISPETDPWPHLEVTEHPPSAVLAGNVPAVVATPPAPAGGVPSIAAFTPTEERPEPATVLQPPPSPAASRAPAFPRLAGDDTRSSKKRWSGDAWLLLREDTTTSITSGRGSYGQSQVGAVLRYRIAPKSNHRIAAYARASTALAEADRPEVAAGVTARPVPGVPVAVAVEARAGRLYYGKAVRGAVFAYTELASLELLAGLRGEAYVQGGYVDGRFASAFIDGQVRMDRQLGRLGNAELRAGGGAWGGAQEGAKRLDFGPAATIAGAIGGAPLRMSADWRFRVAGDANPGSGPALTISTGF